MIKDSYPNKDSSTLMAFPPIVEEYSHALILGTMPSIKSLETQQYYAHPHNQFWPLIGEIIGINTNDLSYTDKITHLKQAGFALWDVLQECERIGSLDSAIKNEIPNDFENFFKTYPSIKKVVFNSETAESIFKRHYKSLMKGYINFFRIPSPSPAHASRSFEEKLIIWKKILEN